MADSSYTTDLEAATDTTETIPSVDSNYVSNVSDLGSLRSNDVGSIKTTTTNRTDLTEEDVKHENIPIHYTSKSRTNNKNKLNTLDVDGRRKSPSPSPGSFNSSQESYHRITNKKEANNIQLKKILDSKPIILSGHHEQPGSAIIDKIFSDIYFDGNWNRGSYNIDDDNEEYKTKQEVQSQFYRPLTVFGDDEMFEFIDLQKKENREQGTFYSSLQFINTPYPLPSQRLKRLLYPFKSFKHIEQQNPNFKKQLEQVNNDEQEYYARIRNKATKLKQLYTQITRYQTNDNTASDIHQQKKEFWHKLRYELNEQNVGVVSEHNIPPWIMKGWYGDCALARNRNLRMPQYKAKTFQSFYPRTARWDRILRGCYELDWNDEDVIMDIINYDANQYSTPLEVILSLRREKLFDSSSSSSSSSDSDSDSGIGSKPWTQFKPFARDPFIHIYDFYNVTHKTLAIHDSIYNRLRDLYWTLHSMWYIGSRFDCDGCLRVPALCNPIEWQYVIALKLIWDGIKLVGYIGKLHACSVKHCGIKDVGTKTMQFLKKVTFAFDFNEKQIYDFRYLLYLLRHTLFNQLFHCLSKHGGKYQIKVFAKQKKEQKYGIEMAHDEEYRFILDYFRFLVISNNMYEFFSPQAMGRLWQYICGTFEELRMIYPEISLNTIENEYQDLLETHRHISVTKTMTAKSYQYYMGNKYYTNKEKNIWQDARGVIKQYCIKNTLFPIPNIFECVYDSHNIKNEANPFLVDIKNLSSMENKNYKKERLKKFLTGFVMNLLEVPNAFYLTEIKYPFLCNLIRACIKYELPEFAQLLLNHSVTSSIQTFQYNNNTTNNSNNDNNNIYKSNVEYHNLNKSQKRYLETRFTWPYILFIEYLSFNPLQFHREHLCHIIEETNHFKQCIRNEKQNYSQKSQRKILSYSNRIKLQKQKFDAWQQAAENDTIPYYPFAVLLRFTICERTNAQIDEDDELKQEGNDFTITKSVITALQTILKFPQFATRILINTYNLKELINNLTYNEFKNVYSAIFKYNSKYQEHPQMYETFKKQWMEYAKQMKALLDIYHEPQHKLHRELIWLGFYQYHQTHCQGQDKKDELFNYYTSTHLQTMFEKHKLDIKQQENSFINDVMVMFKQFGYNEDAQHKFYGNYYREFVEKEEENESDQPEEYEDDQQEEQEQEEEQEEEKEAKEIEQEEDEDNNSFVDTSDDDDEDAEDEDEDSEEDEESDDDEEEDEIKPSHRRMDTDTQERKQFAQQFDIEEENSDVDNNPFAHRNDDSDEEDIHLEKKKSLNINKQDKLDDFEDYESDKSDKSDKSAENKKIESKARGSNEYNAEDVEQIIKKSPAESPLLTNISEEEDILHNQLSIDDQNQQQNMPQNNQPQDNNGDHGDEDDNDDNNNAEDDGLGQNPFGGAAGGDEDDDDDDKDKKKKKINMNDGDGDGDDDDEEEEEEDKEDGLGDISMMKTKKKKHRHEKQGSDVIADVLEELTMANINMEEEQDLLASEFAKNNPAQEDEDEEENAFKVNVGNTVRHMNKKGYSHRNAMLFDDEDNKGDPDGNDADREDNNYNDGEYAEDDDDDDDDDQKSSDDDDDDEEDEDEFKANKEWANTLLNNPNIVGMQSRDAMLQRKEEQQDLYKRHQIIRLKEDEQENLYSILELENTDFIDDIMFNNQQLETTKEFGWNSIDQLVPDVVSASVATPHSMNERDIDIDIDIDIEREIDINDTFSDELFFQIRGKRWSVGDGGVGNYKSDAISSIKQKEAENSYIMLRDLTSPLSLSELLGDFQKAGQIMLSRIDDMQASLIVENKLHSGVLKAHQTDEKNLYLEKDELLNSIEKLESELKLLRDKRDENKSETAALKTKQESYILKYNELKEISTQKLRDQLRCFEIYKSQTKQLEKRIHDVSYQTEIGYKRLNRLLSFKKQQQLNISQLDIEIESMEKEKILKENELLNLENEQLEIEENEKLYVLRLKEQLRRLGKGMENKEKSCNIFRRNVVEERLRIHTIDDSLKKLRTNANPTTSSDQELINATQHEALQAREKYAETTQQHSFLTNIHQHERILIECIEKVQNIDDDIYAKKWNIIQKSWNLKKHLLETGKLIQMKKYLLKKEKNSKKHKKKLSKAHFRKDSMKNLSYGASEKFKKQSQDFGAY